MRRRTPPLPEEVRYLTHDPIDLERWHRDAFSPEDGASVEFLGIVRREEDGRGIESLEYEAYEPMVEVVIGRLIEEANRLWTLHRVEVRHRVGRVSVGECAVFVGVQAPHREEAFAACRFLIDRIKGEAPIWKKGVFREDGANLTDVMEPEGDRLL